MVVSPAVSLAMHLEMDFLQINCAPRSVLGSVFGIVPSSVHGSVLGNVPGSVLGNVLGSYVVGPTKHSA